MDREMHEQDIQYAQKLHASTIITETQNEGWDYYSLKRNKKYI